MAHPSYAIRHAGPADAARLEELLQGLQDHLEASNCDVWRMTEAARLRLRAQIAARIKAPDVCALVADHHTDGVIACAFARIVTNTRYMPERAGVVDQVFVSPDHRRQGVATRLVQGLCRFFADREVTDLSLRFVDGNLEASCFWADLGFMPRIVTTGASLYAVEARLRQALEC